MQKKYKILFLVQLPPPVHGATAMNQNVVDSSLLREHFDVSILPLRFSSSVDGLNKMRVGKILKTVKIASGLFKRLLMGRYDVVYFTLSPVGYAFYRDVLFVFIMKLFRVRILYLNVARKWSNLLKNPM